MNNFGRIKTLCIDFFYPLPPIVGYFKLNIDDSVLGNLGQPSIGGIILNQGCQGLSGKKLLVIFFKFCRKMCGRKNV